MELKVTNYLTLKLSEPHELIELISDEDKVEFMQSLACEDVIIKHVADQIIHGCTDDGFFGSKGCTNHNPSTPLDIAVREITKSFSEIVKKEVESLERALEQKTNSLDEWQNAYYEIYHGRINNAN